MATMDSIRLVLRSRVVALWREGISITDRRVLLFRDGLRVADNAFLMLLVRYVSQMFSVSVQIIKKHG